MTQIIPLKQPDNGYVPYKKIPHVVVLPDGTESIPLGSGNIVSLLGVGGMSNVYEIWNQKLEMKRAVKLLHPGYSVDSKQRFETEIKLTAKLDHPNIVEVHAVGEWNGLPYIEIEKIDGFTLEKLVEDRGALPLEVCTSVGILLCRALHFAHNHEYTLYGESYHGIIHRDLKPGNIMVANTGTVKLMDFGVARPIDASIHTTDSSSVMGTIQYLSPELLEGKSPDIRTDIYSLGAVLYEMITGTKAFSENNISTLMLLKVKNEFKPLDFFSIKIPQLLKKLIQKCLNRDRDRRPLTVREIEMGLERVHKSLTTNTPEEIMNAYMGTTVVSRTEVRIRSKSPAFFFFVICGILAVSASLIFIYHYISIKPVVQASNLSTVQSTTQAPVAPQSVVVPKNAFVKQRTKTSRTIVPNIPKPAIIPIQPSEPIIPQEQSFIDVLKAQYATSDCKEIFLAECKKNHFDSAIKVYDLLTVPEKHAKAVGLYYLRLLKATGNKDQLALELETQKIDDGEFYLSRAKHQFALGNIPACQISLATCLQTSSQFLEPEKVRQEATYYKALCTSTQFNAKSDRQTLQNALDAWYEVKLVCKANPENPWYQEAIQEMQRLGTLRSEIK